MDHMFAAMDISSKSKSTKKEEEERAPIELLSQFLLAVQDRHMKEALGMAEELLRIEPDNKMIKEYVKYIKEYIAQGLDEEDGKDDDEEEDEEEDDDEEEEGEESGDDDDIQEGKSNYDSEGEKKTSR